MNQAPENRRRFWRWSLWISAAALAAALALLLVHFWPLLFPRQVPEEPDPTVSTPAATTEPLEDNPIDFTALQAQYPDVVGWIRIPGTVIDYEVMRPGPDTAEDLYLHHAPDKSYRYSGSIYMQSLNDAAYTDPNTVLYGHYMANGTMFADLHKFRKADFFQQHDTLYIYTPGHILTYRIYAAFVYDDRHILNSFDFYNPFEFQSFISQTLNPSSMSRQIREGVTVTTDDRILTLSTCTTKSTERYLVEGVLIHDQRTK